jgi:hypothetical protein
MREGGEIVQTISLPGRNAYAVCWAGRIAGPYSSAPPPGSGPDREGNADGKIEMIEIAVPGAGLP